MSESSQIRDTMTRTWRASPDTGWPNRLWIEETIRVPGATWFARIAEDDGDPNLPPLVMVHGLIVSGSYFRPVANVLDDHLRLYVPDLPGFGQSRMRKWIWSIPELTDGLAWWMRLHRLVGSVVMANSLGCQVATLLAQRHADLVRALILIAPTMDPEARSMLKLMARGAKDIPRERSSLWNIWLPDLWRAGARRGLGTLREGFRDPQDERLAQVHQPTIAISGERDPIVPVSWVSSMGGSLPRARAIVIPNAPHAMNFSNPRELARIVRMVAGMSDADFERGCHDRRALAQVAT